MPPQPQCPEAMDVHRLSLHQGTQSTAHLVAVQLYNKVHGDYAAAVARDEEELQMMLADLLARLSALVTTW